MTRQDAFKRAGQSTPEMAKRRNLILGHLEDPEREIQFAELTEIGGA